MPQSGTIVNEFPSDPFFLHLIRKWTVDLAREIGIQGQALDEIEMAIGEAASNSIEYGFGESIVLELSFTPDSFSMTLKDKGASFDFAARSAVDPGELARQGSARGYGLALMRIFMDEVIYQHEQGIGNRLTLVKKVATIVKDKP